MISVEPSKIRLMRMSRNCCSAGTARSPRAAPGGALREPQVACEPAELVVGGRVHALSGQQPWQPACVETAGSGGRFDLRVQIRLDRGQIAGGGEVRVDRLAGNEQMHDLCGAFENPVDAHVPQLLLCRNSTLAAGRQRCRCFVSAAAADLHQLVRDPVGHFAGPKLGQCGFDPDVFHTAVGQPGRQFEDRFQGKRRRSNKRDLLPDRLMFAHRASPLDPGIGPLAGDLQRPFSGGRAHGRDR